MLSHLPMIMQCLLLCLVPLLAFVYLLIVGRARAALAAAPPLVQLGCAVIPLTH